MDDPVQHGIIRNKSDDLHVSTALSTNQRVDFKNFADHLRPAPARDSWAFHFDNQELMLSFLHLAHFAPMSVGVQAEVTDSDLALVWDMRGSSGFSPYRKRKKRRPGRLN